MVVTLGPRSLKTPGRGTSKDQLMRVLCPIMAAVAAAFALAAAAPPAQANSSLFSYITDDDLLLYGTYSDRAYAMEYMKRAGADGVRVTVSWKFVSGESDGRPKKQPARLKGKRAENPRSYRSDIWDRFDDIVRLAKSYDMVVLLNVTGP